MIQNIWERDGYCCFIRCYIFHIVCHIRCNISGLAIIIGSSYHHSGWIKCISLCIDHLVRLCCNFDLIDLTAKCHHISRIVFKINGSILIYDWRTDRILCLISSRGKKCIRCRMTSFGCYVVCTGLTSFVSKHTKLSWSHIIKKIDIHITAFFFIGCRKKSTGLRIALRLNTVGNCLFI